MLGFRHGDLTAFQVSGTAVAVTSTTTHPAFANPFQELFQRYGHVYQYPTYEEGKGYKWKLAARLDNSVQFLLTSPEEALLAFSNSRLLFLSWLAGLVDADGTIYLTNNNGTARICMSIGSIKPAVLESIGRILATFGYQANGPYLAYKAGERTPYRIEYINDLWRIYFQRSGEVQRLLTELPILHAEKITQKELALSLNQAAKWIDAEPRAHQIRQQIESEVSAFIEQAKQQHRAKTESD
jgi:hypothetical protein